jgi:hypothetical protein
LISLANAIKTSRNRFPSIRSIARFTAFDKQCQVK